MDSEDIRDAPVWDPELGFGGDGDANVGEVLLRGHCVTNGPFAMLKILYLEFEDKPHCLSRGFAKA